MRNAVDAAAVWQSWVVIDCQGLALQASIAVICGRVAADCQRTFMLYACALLRCCFEVAGNTLKLLLNPNL